MKFLKPVTEEVLKHLHRLGPGRFAMEVCDIVGPEVYARLVKQGKDKEGILDTLRISMAEQQEVVAPAQSQTI